MQIGRKQKIIIYCIIGVVVVFFIERVFISGLRGRLGSLSQKIRLAEGELRKGMEIQETKDQIVADYEKAKPYLEQQKISKKKASAELLKEIESIVRSTEGTVINLSPQEVPGREDLYKADFRLELSFSQFITFLHKVQESKLFIKVDKLSISPKDKIEAKVLKVEGVISMTLP
jgi:hypothetical protein